MPKYFTYAIDRLKKPILSHRVAVLNGASSSASEPIQFPKNKPWSPLVLCRTFLVSRFNCCKMVDPKRVVSYEDMLKVIHQPEKVIIDVRNPDEVHVTGKIPSSINIPLNTVQDVLTSMSDEEFKTHYQRNKPSSSDELIFYCQSGRRSTEALDKALKLGYANSKTYLGSWNDWSSRQK